MEPFLLFRPTDNVNAGITADGNNGVNQILYSQDIKMMLFTSFSAARFRFVIYFCNNGLLKLELMTLVDINAHFEHTVIPERGLLLSIKRDCFKRKAEGTTASSYIRGKLLL